MRVIGGELGGRRLRAPSGAGTRPTTELVRGALFDALESRLGLRGLRALDLYAGSGALGIEALSRGCAEACFVESDPRASAVLRANLQSLALGGRARVLHARVERVVNGPVLRGSHFALVLADPPYALGAAPVLAALSAGPEWLSEEALCALEHPTREELPDASGTLWRVWHRTYGGSAWSVYAVDCARAGTSRAASAKG